VRASLARSLCPVLEVGFLLCVLCVFCAPASMNSVLPFLFAFLFLSLRTLAFFTPQRYLSPCSAPLTSPELPVTNHAPHRAPQLLFFSAFSVSFAPVSFGAGCSRHEVFAWVLGFPKPAGVQGRRRFAAVVLTLLEIRRGSPSLVLRGWVWTPPILAARLVLCQESCLFGLTLRRRPVRTSPE